MQRVFMSVALVAALLLAACGTESQDADATADAQTDAGAATAQATADATPATDATDGDDDAGADGDGATTDVARLLPTEVGDMTLEVTGVTGEEFMADADPAFEAFLGRLGRAGSDVSGGTAVGFNEAGDSLFIFAIRIAGANPDELRDEFQAAMEQEAPEPFTAEEMTLGGKEVVRTQGGDTDDGSAGSTYLYTAGDILFLIGASSEELAAEALEELP